MDPGHQDRLPLSEVEGAELEFGDLALDDLRSYRRRLADEEERVSYWRRLVHARVDVLEAETHHERPLRLHELVRVLGDTGSGRGRTALVRVRAEEPLPELPVLEQMWVTEIDVDDTAAVREAIDRLLEAEAQLTAYRRALHLRIDEADRRVDRPLPGRPSECPGGAASAPQRGGRTAVVTPPAEDVGRVWKEFRATGDAGLRNRLVLQYAPLVKYVAGRVRTRLPDNVDPDDLVSDGVLGLMDAIERFEPDRGLSFQTFAVPRIRGAIIDGMRAMDFVPRSVRDKLRVVQRAQLALEERLGRAPGEDELAAEAGMPVSTLRDLSKQGSSNHANLDDFDLADELSNAAEHRIEDGAVSASVMQVVDGLGERDRILIALYYFEGLTLAEIGQVLGVTESRVSQLHRRAMTTLRTRLVEVT